MTRVSLFTQTAAVDDARVVVVVGCVVGVVVVVAIRRAAVKAVRWHDDAMEEETMVVCTAVAVWSCSNMYDCFMCDGDEYLPSECSANGWRK